jgi:L-aminopeptidase/D-esterase-like protein
VIFDLSPLGRFDARPNAAMAYDACDRAVAFDVAEGSVGVGTGATVGKIAGPSNAMKGGFGCALESSAEWMVGAMAVVNALGDVRDAGGRIIAGARLPGAEASAERYVDAERLLAARLDATVGTNTTLCVVATSVPLGRNELSQLARASGAALFRRISPAGTSVDGDVIFALAPAADPVSLGPKATALEALAVAALERAIERAVRTARGRDGIPGLADA